MAGKNSFVKVFNCPSCSGSVTVRASGFSITAVCESCNSIIDTKNENYAVLSEATQKMKRQSLIELGTRGRLRGELWEIIGYMERDDGDRYRWSEYLLFNPTKGFRWLTEAGGHWNFVLMVKERPEKSEGGVFSNRPQIKYMNKKYEPFHRGKAVVKYVIGEFYWQVKQDEVVDVVDYICPPEILSREQNRSEVVWSLGEYISADDVKAAFQIEKMPLQKNVAPNQPFAPTTVRRPVTIAWIGFLIFLFAFHIFSNLFAKEQVVFQKEFVYVSNATENERVLSSEPFELKDGTKNLSVRFYADIKNKWMEFAAELVNDTTGESIPINQGIEFYQGVDTSGWAWHEGSQEVTVGIPAVPSGTYHFNVEATTEANTPSPWTNLQTLPVTESFSITVRRDIGIWSNFFIALFLISIYPIIVRLRATNFEMKRWSQSDLSPYSEHQEDEA